MIASIIYSTIILGAAIAGPALGVWWGRQAERRDIATWWRGLAYEAWAKHPHDDEHKARLGAFWAWCEDNEWGAP